MFQRNDTGEERKFEKKITVVRRLSNVSDAIVIYIIPLAVPLPFINTFWCSHSFSSKPKNFVFVMCCLTAVCDDRPILTNSEFTFLNEVLKTNAKHRKVFSVLDFINLYRFGTHSVYLGYYEPIVGCFSFSWFFS